MKNKVIGTLISSVLATNTTPAVTIQVPNTPHSAYNWEELKLPSRLLFTNKKAHAIEANVFSMKDRLKDIIHSIYGDDFNGYAIEHYPNDESEYVNIFDESLTFEENETKFVSLKRELREKKLPYTALIGG